MELYMSYLEKYNEWLNDPAIDEETKEKLKSIKNDVTATENLTETIRNSYELPK